jgi:drug/metabolite transporter (DMT)-like permease
MRLNKFRPGWPLIMLGISLQFLGAAALGMGGYALLEYFGWAGGDDADSDALLVGLVLLLASGLLAGVGTVLLRRGERRG